MINKNGKRFIVSLHLFLALLILTPVLVPYSSATDEELITLTGLVIDFKTRQPINNATVIVWDGRIPIAQNYTNDLSTFAVQVPSGRNYRIYIYSEAPIPLGWDYLPALEEVLAPTGDVNLTVELRLGASVIIDNDIQFLDMTTPVKTYTWEVRDPKSGETLEIRGYRPVYGTVEEAHSHFLNLNASYIVVPAEVLFDIRVNASVIIGGKMVARSFIIDEPGHLNLSKGDLIHLDVRKYSLQYNLGSIEEKINEVESKMNEMEGLGFYLFLEKEELATVSGMVDKARFNLLRGAYVDSFTELRRAYIDITDLFNNLVGMFRSAETSIFVLIFFLAFAAVAIAFLIFEKSLYKVAISGGLTALFHVILHEIYPGADYISTTSFLEFSVIAWCVVLFTTIVVPHFLKGRGVGGRVPLMNIIVPIFSLAKRSLTRRRLRFILTLSSVTFLVMSFVALTSFTMGYGLIMRRISGQEIPVDGVLVRAPRSQQEAVWSKFTPLDITAIDWFKKQSEVEVFAPKAENLAFFTSLLALGGKPIYGVIGVLPSTEAQILGLDKIVIEGRYLLDEEEDAILISDDLKEELGVEVNATLPLGEMRVHVIGFFEGEKMRGLKDLDGINIIPNKLIDYSAPDEPPDIRAVPVETDELLLCNLETALKIPGVFLSRIDVTLREGEPVNDFAERVALGRNYNTWASSVEGLYIARLGTSFQGKGLPLIIPWAIVVLNVIITMLNVLYERRREISILSSVGLNPSHIGGIFIAESVAIGLIGSGLGYLLGLGMYRVMALLHITLEVRQKVSALWSLGALAIAMTAVIIGAFSALKGSVIITPSLMRRWRIEEREEIWKPLEIIMPIRVPKDEIDDFMGYVLEILKGYEEDQTARTGWFRVWKEDTEERSTRGIRFSYRTVGPATGTYSSNRLLAERRRGEDVYMVRMLSTGNREWVHHTGSLIRLIIMRWSTIKR